MELESLPAYRRAIAHGARFEEALRESAWLPLGVQICGVPVRQLTLRHLLMLFRGGSPFLCGGRVRRGHVAAFLWCVSPLYVAPGSDPAAAERRAELTASL